LRHYLARQAGQANMARAAFPPIACSWSGIERRRDFMEMVLLKAVGASYLHADL
jgi:hypothetical protein